MRNSSTVSSPTPSRPVGEALAERDRVAGDLRVDRRRGDALDEDARVVDVAREREGAVRPSRRGRRRSTARLEGHLGLGEQRLAGGTAEALDRIVDLGRADQADLAAAVVAAGRDLESQRQAELVGGRPQVVGRADLAPRRDRRAGRLEEPPLGEPVLGHVERHAPGRTGPIASTASTTLEGDVLQLVGDDVARLGQPEGRPDVVVAGDDIRSARAAAGQAGSGSRTAIR